MQAIEGWRGRLEARGIIISMEGWTCKSSGTKVPANDFENPHRRWKCGLRGTEVEFSGYVDLDNIPWPDAGGGLRVGQLIECRAHLIKNAAFYRFTQLLIFEVEAKDEVDGRVDITIRGETDGSWFYPQSLPSFP